MTFILVVIVMMPNHPAMTSFQINTKTCTECIRIENQVKNLYSTFRLNTYCFGVEK